MSKRLKMMDVLSVFFVRLGFRAYMAALLLLSLALFALPAVLGMRRAFSHRPWPTVQAEYAEWIDWIDLLVVIIISGEPVDG